MSLNPVIEAIKSRRAIRSFEDKSVPDSAIQTILEAATYAPSAINVQPWKFTLITNKDFGRIDILVNNAGLRIRCIGNENHR